MDRAQRPHEAPDLGLAARTVTLAVVAAPNSPGARPVRVRPGKTDHRPMPRRGWASAALASTVVLVAAAGGLVLGLGPIRSGATPAASASPGPAPSAAASPAPYPLSPASAAPPIVPRGGPASTARSASGTPRSSASTRSTTSARHAPSRSAQRTPSTSDG